MTVLGTVLMSLQFAPIFLNTEIWSTGISKKSSFHSLAKESNNTVIDGLTRETKMREMKIITIHSTNWVKSRKGTWSQKTTSSQL